MTPQRRILLVSANRHREPYPVYPLGLSYLKSYLRRRMPHYEVLLFDCNLGSVAQLEELIRRERPDVVGVSLRNVDGANSLREGNFLAGYLEITQAVRRAGTAPLLIGGAGFSIFPEHFMEATGADYGLAGEGEESLAQLLEALDEGREPHGIDGLFLRGGAADREPYPRPRSRYLLELDVEFEEEWVAYYWKYSGMLNIQTKRGCPYDCVYCSYPVIDGRTMRTLDAAKIVDDIIRLKRSMGVDYLFFTDSVFNICPGFNARLAEELIRREAGIRWGAYFTPLGLGREELELYRRSGLTHIEFGTESFDDATLEAYGKRFTFDDVLRASEAALAANVYYAHFLILGAWARRCRACGGGLPVRATSATASSSPTWGCASTPTRGSTGWPSSRGSSRPTTRSSSRATGSAPTSTWSRRAPRRSRRARRGSSLTTRPTR